MTNGGTRRYERPAMLGGLCCATFLATSSAIAITPFLLDIARDLDADLSAVGNLVALQSATWGIASVIAGVASDRLGRKPILVAGLLVLAVSTLGVTLAGTYGLAAAWRLLGGVGGGAFMGTVFAAVSDHFPPAERGRSLGWIVTGQSMSLVLGVPTVTLIGALGGWRGSLAVHASVTLAAALGVWLVVPRAAPRRAPRQLPAGAVVRLLGRRVLILLAASTAERLCYSAVTVFLPTFLLATYGVSLGELALGLALVALGNLVGNLAGGQLSDRLAARPLVFAASLAGTGLLALPVLLWQPGVGASVGLGFLYTLVNALGRPALLAALSEVSSQARGAVLGVNITFSSFGWLGATLAGGWLISAAGFGALGALTAAVGLAGATLAAASVLVAGPEPAEREAGALGRVAAAPPEAGRG